MTQPSQGPMLPPHFGDYAVQGFIAEQEGGLGWWQTCIASALIDLSRLDGFTVIIAGIAKVLRSGVDPNWAVGSPEAKAAIDVTLEWLAEQINPRDVEGWLLAGCWSPRIAKALAGAGISPQHLLDANRQPAQWVEVADGQRVPVALAVIEWELPVADAVRIVADSYTPRSPTHPQRGGQPT